MKLEQAREELARCLRRDARLHSEMPAAMGPDFDELDARLPRIDRNLSVGIAFWDAWLDERNHGFPGHYEEIATADWPVLAEQIASALEAGRDIDDVRIVKHFAFSDRRASS